MQSLAERSVVGSAIEEICALLPKGWVVHIELELEAGTVRLEDPDGDTVDFDTNHDGLANELRDALEWALEPSHDY